tara:strand:- start:1252 stop:1485 length:234 start_codon:yes stop_codon:yes gene_type:complete
MELNEMRTRYQINHYDTPLDIFNDLHLFHERGEYQESSTSDLVWFCVVGEGSNRLEETWFLQASQRVNWISPKGEEE